MKKVISALSIASLIFTASPVLATEDIPSNMTTIKEEKINSFYPVSEEKMTEAQKAFVAEVKGKAGVFKKDNFYVISLGQKPHRGWKIEFDKQVVTWEQIKVYFKITKPDPKALYPQVIDYPYVAGTINIVGTNTLSLLNSETGESFGKINENESEIMNVFTPVSINSLKYDEKLVVDHVKTHKGVFKYGNMYVISMGEVPTGGYSIKHVKSELKGNNLNVYVKQSKPDKDTIVTQALKYPVEIGYLHLDKNLSVHFIDAETNSPFAKVADVDFLDKRKITDPKKEWKITFTRGINKETLNSKNIYIKNNVSQWIKTEISIVNNTVTIKPLEDFKADVEYYLHISPGITKSSIILPFELEK